ncbi:hypothetical protein BZL30_3927 [Mycobacterium kansasii]|uniref:Uncharacterized protein n=1 Tax=Mycobacterium kansasii TaxID=1768 RepID=A0A1V3XAL2_MYCKA|nr:hypothetical protein BZL30_3927 [Mycobacterium kansasii]
MASRAARAAETGTDGNTVRSSADSRFSFSGASGGGAGRAGGAMRADAGRVSLLPVPCRLGPTVPAQWRRASPHWMRRSARCSGRPR